MINRPLRDNPIWLYIGSILIFSFVICLLLLSRDFLFPQQISTVKKSVVSPTPTIQELSIAIPSLKNKEYKPVKFTQERVVSSTAGYTSSIVSFTVEGLKEYALLDIPNSQMPDGGFPVIVLNHGYINPKIYDTVSSYSSIVNFFATQGFIVIKPDYRGNGNSEGFDDPLKRFNYPVDVMTVLTSLKNIPQANTKRVYLWGHSMGGEVTLEALEILGKQKDLGQAVKATVLWAPVTNPGKWFGKDNINKLPEARLTPYPYTKTFEILGQPSDTSPIWQSINPLNFLSDISIPIQLNHGTADTTVPYSWTEELNSKMKTSGKSIEFISYPGADHNMAPDSSQALSNNLQFFKSH